MKYVYAIYEHPPTYDMAVEHSFYSTEERRDEAIEKLRKEFDWSKFFKKKFELK